MRRALLITAIVSVTQLFAQETLPPGPGKQLVLDTCVQCHDFKWITGQRKSEAAWRQTVNMMIWRGAPLMPGEAGVISKYLAQLPAGTVPGDAGRGGPRPYTEAALPEGRGRALVISACVQCHDLGGTVDQHKTLSEWRRSVDEMVRLGAKLTGSEIEVVARYLVQSFGPPK